MEQIKPIETVQPPKDTSVEDALVEKAKTDEQAFTALYNQYLPRVYGYMMKRIGNKEATEDLVSMTFLKVFSNLKKYEKKGGVPFGAWLFRIATNNLIDYYRKHGKIKSVDIDAISEPKDEKLTAADEIQIEQDRAKVREVLKDVSSRYQEILNLKFFAEMSYEEIAETLGLTVNNSRVLVFRALKVFQKQYQKYAK